MSKKLGQGHNFLGNDLKVFCDLDGKIKEDEREHLEEDEEDE